VAAKESHHTSAIRKSLPKMRKSAETVENPAAAGCKSLPKVRKSAEKVEIPKVADREFLPKRRKTWEKGRESKRRRLEISTQTAEIPGKR
jgi:hypothetical protein